MSVPFDTTSLLRWTGGEQRHGDGSHSHAGVCIDSRALVPGELFVAIRGPHHDGHRFLATALEAGASGLLIQRDAVELLPQDLAANVSIVLVDDTTASLGAMAAGHRAEFRGPVVAITGSNGKTTTKEMCAAILSQRGPCLKNEGNLNNEFGLPLTLLRRNEQQWSAVVELGMNHRGEIARLTRIARPCIGVITNVGSAHIEHLGSREEIAREKGDLIAHLPPNGISVLNRDDPRVDAQASRAPGRVVSFGHDPSADVHAHGVRFLDEGAFRFDLSTPQGERVVRVPGLAETSVINALAATAAALEAGATLDEVVAGLADFQNVGGRMARRALPGDVTLIDDTYNANPQSVRAALESLSQLKGKGRGVAVLGDMGELGSNAEDAHRDAGRWTAELGIDYLFAIGDRAETVASGAEEAGMPATHIHIDRVRDPERTSVALREVLRPSDWVLVKGSRAMRMERVVEDLARQLEAQGN